MVLPDRIRLPFDFDAAALERDLAALAGVAWTSHVARMNYEGSWSIIPLRGPAGERHPLRMISADQGGRAFEDTPMLEACPYLRQVLATFRCPLRSARLMRLTPGSIIKPHEDVDLCAERGFARIHVPVLTSPDVEFLLNDAPVVMTPGSCWYLRLSDPHSAANRGATDRVHLVIDAEVDAWLGEVLEDAALATAAA